MADICIEGRCYSTIIVSDLMSPVLHPRLLSLGLQADDFRWVLPGGYSGALERGWRPVTVTSDDGKELAFCDDLYEQTLFTVRPVQPVAATQPQLPTTLVRKEALRLAREIYEIAGGSFMQNFDPATIGSRLGLADAAIDQISDYLAGARIIERPYLGSSKHLVRLTANGIRTIEASIDHPDNASGPFPPMNVVIGDIAAGAQVAIGSGHFSQQQTKSIAADEIVSLLALIKAAIADFDPTDRATAARALANIEAEAASDQPDRSMIVAMARRIADFAERTASGVASGVLLAYMKANGWLP